MGARQSDERYAFRCGRTGVIKAYKRMSSRRAGERNARLCAEGSLCRWTPVVTGRAVALANLPKDGDNADRDPRGLLKSHGSGPFVHPLPL